MSSRSSITIVHLSDLQFGAKHRFKVPREVSAVDDLDTLEQRLCDDLADLRERKAIEPDLLIVSGDIAEFGKKSEYADVLEFLKGVAGALGLGMKRVLVVPGNHDINWASCEAYFKECEAEELDPSPPFWPKWKWYARFVRDLYGTDSEAFEEERPWSLFPLEDLMVVVACMNSTIAESHRKDDHHGLLSERQIRWFRDQLQPYKDRGWLRIGVLHHNVERLPKHDDHNLRDADAFKRLLAPELNLVLHGHLHELGMGWAAQNVPILATGSAGVNETERAPESPNQYQVLRITQGSLERWCRRFDPKDSRWIADSRVSSDGDKGEVVHDIPFRQAGSTFGEEPRAGRWTRWTDEQEDAFARGRRPRTSFADEVAEVCSVRNPGARVEVLEHDSSSLTYLRVIENEGAFTRLYPVGVFERRPTRDDVERFRSHVDARFRRHNPQVDSELVYGGEGRADPSTVAFAESQRIQVFSFVEYLGILDFSEYVARQSARIKNDPVYPPSLYVPQRFSVRDAGWRAAWSVDDDPALDVTERWLRSPEGRFAVLLGNAGSGKTFLLRSLALRLARAPRAPIPILIEMRDLQKARDLDQLVVQQLTAGGMKRWDRDAFRYMLKQGQIALLFDGYDELEVRTTYERAAEHFDTLLQASLGRAKVVVTSRTEHFLTDADAEKALMKKVDVLPGLRIGKIEEFTDEQILEFLGNHPNTEEDPGGWMKLLRDVRDLLGLSRNPRMLSFIVELEREKLEEARDRDGKIDSSELYRILIEQWIGHNLEKAQPRGATGSLTEAQCWRAVEHLALRLWRQTRRSIHGQDLEAEFMRAFDGGIAQEVEAPASMAEATQAVGSGSLLVRDPEGNFSFIHQSVLEWLVARQAAHELAARGGAPEVLDQQAMSAMMADFLIGLAGADVAIAWARQVLDAGESEFGQKNALLVLKQAKAERRDRLRLRGDLRNVDLASLDLVGADLAGCNLSSVQLRGRELQGVNLRGADLARADLFGADLRSADVRGANFDGATLSRADLRGSEVEGASFTRTKLLNASLGRLREDAASLFGAALPGLPVSPSIPLRSFGRVVAWSPHNGLLASGHDDGSVRLWDVATGEELRRLDGHVGTVRSIAFGPDGTQLASSGDTDGSGPCVLLWNVETGDALRRFEGHRDSVRSVAFSPLGALLVSAGADSSVRLWDVATGEEVMALLGHAGMVYSVAFSSDGSRIASGGADGTVRLWDVGTGSELHRLKGHGDWVYGVAFSPTEARLASAGADGSVRLWDSETGDALNVFDDAQGRVYSVAFSPDGARLVSSGVGGVVQLIDVQTGREMRWVEGLMTTLRSIAFSTDGSHVALAGHVVEVWDVATGEKLRRLGGYESRGYSVLFSPDGERLASAGSDGSVRLWDARTGEELRRIEGHEEEINRIAFSPDGVRIASVDVDASVRLWDATTGEELRRFEGHVGAVWDVAFSPNGRQLATAGDDGVVHLWDSASGEELRRFAGHDGMIWSVAFDRDGSRLVSAGADDSVRLWETGTGVEIRRLKGHRNEVNGVAFSPDGRRLASASDDGSVRLWDVATGETLFELVGHEGTVWSVAFSPDGKQLASVATDQTVRLWDSAKGKELERLEGHGGVVWSVAFSPDGGRVASVGAGGYVRLWSLHDEPRLQATLLPLPEGWVAYTPENRYRSGGNVSRHFGFTIGLCRFAPDELDEALDEPLRLPEGAPLRDD